MVKQIKITESVVSATKSAIKAYPHAVGQCEPSPSAALTLMTDLIRAYLEHEMQLSNMQNSVGDDC